MRSSGDRFEDARGGGGERIRTAYVDRSALGFLEADVAHIQRAAVQRLHGREAHVTQGALALVKSDVATIRQSAVGALVARSVACDEVHVGVLVTPVVRGDVHTWFDLRTAVALGFGLALGRAAIALASALIRRAR